MIYALLLTIFLDNGEVTIKLDQFADKHQCAAAADYFLESIFAEPTIALSCEKRIVA